MSVCFNQETATLSSFVEQKKYLNSKKTDFGIKDALIKFGERFEHQACSVYDDSAEIIQELLSPEEKANQVTKDVGNFEKVITAGLIAKTACAMRTENKIKNFFQKLFGNNNE